MLRTGRLAYHNPRWTPASADASPARDPADLAATAGDLPVVLAAVHHATDVISRVAACDAEAVRDAASSRRLYLPTRLLPEDYDIPCRYASLAALPGRRAARRLRGRYHCQPQRRDGTRRCRRHHRLPQHSAGSWPHTIPLTGYRAPTSRA